ncbi:hypothetical protein GCM10009832_04950 [Dietzia kunjamensis subsp. schimae]
MIAELATRSVVRAGFRCICRSCRITAVVHIGNGEAASSQNPEPRNWNSHLLVHQPRAREVSRFSARPPAQIFVTAHSSARRTLGLGEAWWMRPYRAIVDELQASNEGGQLW